MFSLALHLLVLFIDNIMFAEAELAENAPSECVTQCYMTRNCNLNHLQASMNLLGPRNQLKYKIM